MSVDGIIEYRRRFIRDLRLAVADGALEPHEAAAVLSSALAEMVAAVRCPDMRTQYLRDLAEGFPAAVEVERAGVDGMVRQ